MHPRRPFVELVFPIALVCSAGLLARAPSAQGPTFGVPAAVGGPADREDTAIAFDRTRGRTVLFGEDMGYLSDTWEWDGIAWVQRLPATIPVIQGYGPAAYDLAYAPGIGVVFAQGDPTSWTWDGIDWHPRTGPATLEGRAFAAIAYHGGANPGVLLCGTPHQPPLVTNETWSFDGTTWSLRSTSGPTARLFATAAYSPLTASTYMIGGSGFSFPLPVNETWRWDGVNWTLVNDLGTPPWPLRQLHATTWDEGRQQLVVVSRSHTHFGRPLPESPNDVVWTSVPLPPSMTNHCSSLAYDSARQRVVWYAGHSTSQSTVALRELPQGSTTWIDVRSPAAKPPARAHADLAWGPYDGTLLFGGWNGTQALADTWSFDGTRWTNRGASATTAARLGTALCRNGFGSVVMFGGGPITGTPFADTRAWNGADWAPMSLLFGPVPPGRMCHDMVFDSAGNRVVMFGGRGNASSLADTWALSPYWFFGSYWAQIASTGAAPPARNSHRMAYDARRQRVVLFGGCSAGGWSLGDTWELVGDTWTQVFPTQSPLPRWNHTMDFDPARGVVVLIGGYSNASFLNDVWEYDGTTWTQRVPKSTAPSPREGAGFVWDGNVNRFVIHGGYSWASNFSDETWYYDGR